MSGLRARWLLAAGTALGLSIAASAEPAAPPCTGTDNRALPAELAPMAHGGMALVAGRDRDEAATLAVGTAANVGLLPQSEVRFEVHASKDHVASPYAGALALHVVDAATYEVASGAPAWIDVVRGFKTIDSSGHTPGPRCSSVHKIVFFPLERGDYVLQVSNSPDARIAVIIVRKPLALAPPVAP